MANRNGGFIGTDGLDAPDPVTDVTPTSGNAQVSVAFTAPTDTGTSAITGFVVQVSTDGTDYSTGSNTGTSSPIVVSSLTNGTAATAKVWAINAYGTSAPSDASNSFTPVLPRGVFGGGGGGNRIEYIAIASEGNSTDFGDLTVGRSNLGAVASSSRGVFAGGGSINVLDYITIASTGNASDFGDFNVDARYDMGSASNSTRGVFGGGQRTGDGRTNVIDYITIASTGNAVDFGDRTIEADNVNTSSIQSPTRGVFAGGSDEATGTRTDVMDYVTIATLGNAADFGNLSERLDEPGGCSNSTRGLIAGGFGQDTGTFLNVINYITIASTGNSSDFGDLTVARRRLAACSSSLRGVFAGGSSNNVKNEIDFVTIGSTGNASDFGDLTTDTLSFSGLSNVHGGL